MTEARKAFFLDRDGVINRYTPNGYATEWGKIDILPTAPEAIARIKAVGYLALVVTNQSGIAKGLFREETLEDIHIRLNGVIAQRTRAQIDAFYYCPHGKSPLACDCRKPMPGMVLRAAAEHGIDLARSWMIGDSDSDRECADAAGVPYRMLPRDGDLLKLVEEIMESNER